MKALLLLLLAGCSTAPAVGEAARDAAVGMEQGWSSPELLDARAVPQEPAPIEPVTIPRVDGGGPVDAVVPEEDAGTVEPEGAAPKDPDPGPRSQMVGECPAGSACTDLGIGGLDACVPADAVGFDPLTNGLCVGSCERLLAAGVLYEQRCMRPSASYPLDERWCVVICYQ